MKLGLRHEDEQAADGIVRIQGSTKMIEMGARPEFDLQPFLESDIDTLVGYGLGKEMIRRVLRIGFEDHGLHRIELAVYSQNEAAIRCYEHVGFKKEGFLRDVTQVGSDYWSEYRMSMLDSEWLALQRPVT